MLGVLWLRFLFFLTLGTWLYNYYEIAFELWWHLGILVLGFCLHECNWNWNWNWNWNCLSGLINRRCIIYGLLCFFSYAWLLFMAVVPMTYTWYSVWGIQYATWGHRDFVCSLILVGKPTETAHNKQQSEKPTVNGLAKCQVPRVPGIMIRIKMFSAWQLSNRWSRGLLFIACQSKWSWNCEKEGQLEPMV